MDIVVHDICEPSGSSIKDVVPYTGYPPPFCPPICHPLLVLQPHLWVPHHSTFLANLLFDRNISVFFDRM